MHVKKQQLELEMEQQTGTKFWKEYVKAIYCHPVYLNLYAEYIRQNGWSTAGIKVAGRNINNLRYTDDTTLMLESEEELQSLLIKVKKESEKAGLKPNIQKNKDQWHLVLSLHGKKMEKQWKQWETLFWGA